MFSPDLSRRSQPLLAEKAGKRGAGLPVPRCKRSCFLVVFLAEVALQQALESLAVAGLVAGHLMDGVVDGVKIQRLGALGKIGLAGLKIGCFPGKSSETETYFKALRNIFFTSFVQIWYIFLSEKSSHVPF